VQNKGVIDKANVGDISFSKLYQMFLDDKVGKQKVQAFRLSANLGTILDNDDEVREPLMIMFIYGAYSHI
jgi:hypothetical protein